MSNSRKIKRYNFGKIPELFEVSNLIAIQTDSYNWFLQKEIPADKRKLQGLQEIFVDIFPITDFSEKVVLEFVEYKLGESKYEEEECRERDITYGIPLYIRLRLIIKETGEIKEQEIYCREIPLMTPRGTFIINGADRVVVSQLHRSPGVFYNHDPSTRTYEARIVPYRGIWLEFLLDQNNVLWARIGYKKKVALTTFLRALGYSTNSQIMSLFFSKMIKTYAVNKPQIINLRLAEEIIIQDKKYPIGTRITKEIQDIFNDNNITEVKVVMGEKISFYSPILNTFEHDETSSPDEAFLKIYSVLRPGEPLILENARANFTHLFFDPKRYDLSRMGRFKINQKLGLNIPETERTLGKDEIIEMIKYLVKLPVKQGEIDDIDHLGNRRIRTVGELLQNQLRIGLVRLQRNIKERMAIQDIETMTPQTVVNIKPLTAIINDFFTSSQLSQFMDQTNPLAELTHKRRLSALGQGGLSKERAGFEVRDVHHSHYGRICPIETPEGPNIGLIVSLATYGLVNEYGFIETPYRKVIDGKVTDQVDFLTAIEEDKYKICQASVPYGQDRKLQGERISVRYRDSFLLVSPKEIDYMDTFLKQMISVATSLIPFLEHDDANRALMGSNMQRQSVPLIHPEPPLVGTGMEYEVARNSGLVIISDADGVVKKVTAEEITISGDDGREYLYKLIKFKRSNQDICINQKPIVYEGERVSKGEILTEGGSTAKGELALGRNLLVAFMPWEGYNFEDAIIISEKLVREDIFTTIHIEKFEVEARNTQLGPEVITADVPNLGDELLKNLDESGIVRVGAKVKSGNILVGKISPKGETDLSPEYKLLHSIFGEKIKDVKDSSLRLPYGNEGIVIDVKEFFDTKEDPLPTGIEELVKVSVATKRKINVGDKIAGRHGNKGVIARILPEEDMPYLSDGTHVELILNPLSVPSRMNVGQLLEIQLGWAAHKLNKYVACPAFDGATEEEIHELLKEAGLPTNGKTILYDGKTGLPFEQPITVGYIYMMKLIHLVEDKIHARSIGPYSLITQQPLGGKAQFGGQRLGEMEVWALEAYGAAYTLQELLTVKSDDIIGRAKVYEAIVKGESPSLPGAPESFNVLLHEIQGLALNARVMDGDGKEIDMRKIDEERRTKYGERPFPERLIRPMY